jgi:hypothetical protein
MPKKIILDIDDLTWKKVLELKKEYSLKNNNQAVKLLILRGLNIEDKSVS